MKRRAPSRTIPTLAAAALLLLAASSPASAGIFDRARKIGAALTSDTAVMVGTALTSPQRVSPTSDETEAWVFSTTLGRTLERVRFTATDLQRAIRDVQPGATVVILATSPARSDGAVLASRWRAEPEGNPLRSEFIRANRHRILVFGLRNNPDALKRIYAGHMGELRQVAIDLAATQEALLRLGITADGGAVLGRVDAEDLGVPFPDNPQAPLLPPGEE